jgi:predicted GTPase
MVRKAIIMGAAGRDFHNFNIYFRNNPDYRVVGFTAAQISDLQPDAEIASRRYPAELAGEEYPGGIGIYPESMLEELIDEYGVDEIFFSYSDVSHEYVMHEASRVLSSGASFTLLGPKATMIKTNKPIISICAARTGSGKSPTTRWLVKLLKKQGWRVVVIRHPMPYGVLEKQRVQRFETLEDLDRYECTIEEREDYEPHIEEGAVVFAGVDYAKILEEAEKEADILLWDGGNNDLPFYVTDIHVVLVDPHRPGDEMVYHPGETNVRMADLIIVSKVNTAESDAVLKVIDNVNSINPEVERIKANIVITVDNPEAIQGKSVLVIEDGPTLTHGGMSYGAATIKAIELGAEIVDPRPWAKGSIKHIYDIYPHLGKVLPAVGYSPLQMQELNEVISRTPCDLVLLGTPTDLRRYLAVDKPVHRVRYEFEEVYEGELERWILSRLNPLLNN